MGRMPTGFDELNGEVGNERAARAIGMYLELDAVLADVMAVTDHGFGGAAGAVFDAAMRDRILATPPRAMFTALAPVAVARLARP
jgi:hypothetical protein